ncbi:uncharacterized protein LOC124267412 [Haliotis rubra]|uniref:uncharacterized protein LOC124267412 n=1 Tax=Haliotis rubra TaxID=36100 RepID=UPI001EE564D9|nr:uncharacterized protein LOC124267412 [Haliotis rubra]
MKETRVAWKDMRKYCALQAVSDDELKPPYLPRPSRPVVQMDPPTPAVRAKLRPSAFRSESAFISPWVSDDRRAVTYMLHPSLEETRLLRTLFHRKATNATINKALNDLRRLKGQLHNGAMCSMSSADDIHSLLISADGTSSSSSSSSSFSDTPLHRCLAKTSVRVGYGYPTPCARDDGATGDANFRYVYPGEDDSGLDTSSSTTTSSSSSSSGSFCLHLRTSPAAAIQYRRLYPRRRSSIRKFISRVSRFFRTRRYSFSRDANVTC